MPVLMAQMVRAFAIAIPRLPSLIRRSAFFLPPRGREGRGVSAGEAAAGQEEGLLADHLEAGADGAAGQEAAVHVLQDDAQLEVAEDDVEVKVSQVVAALLLVAGGGLLPGGEAGQGQHGGAGGGGGRPPG